MYSEDSIELKKVLLKHFTVVSWVYYSGVCSSYGMFVVSGASSGLQDNIPYNICMNQVPCVTWIVSSSN